VVLEPRRPFAVLAPLEETSFDESVETLGQHVSRRANVPLNRVEAMNAVVDLTQDQQRPAFADDLQRGSDGTGTGNRLDWSHRNSLAESVCFSN